MTTQDLFVTPMYFILLLMGAYMIRSFVTNRDTKQYFIPGLMVKFAGAIAIGLVYQFYYTWGDTYSYFSQARIIWGFFLNSPIIALRIIFQQQENLTDLFMWTGQIWTFRSPNNFAFIRILSFINFFTFSTYSATALFLAAFSFSGSWALYAALFKKYNVKNWTLAGAVLYIPSVVIWGSGIFKDTITYGALLWLTAVLFHLIEFKKINLFSIIMALLSFWMIAEIKPYILICYLPLAIIWLMLKQIKHIRSVAVKYISIPFLVSLGLAGGYFAMVEVSVVDNKYAIDNIAETTMVTAYDIAYFSGAGGSTYTLGSLDGSWSSMLVLLPQAINVSLFRPYIWEVNNPLMLLSSLESMFFLYFTLKLIFRLRTNLYLIASDPFILFCLCFALVFAFAVGISTYNFGTLVRYKIPLMPFYGLLIVLINKHKSN